MEAPDIRTEEGRAASKDAEMAAAVYCSLHATAISMGEQRWAAIAHVFECRTDVVKHGRTPERIARLESCLAELESAGSPREKHDLLIDLAMLLRETEPDRAQTYHEEAQRIANLHSRGEL